MTPAARVAAAAEVLDEILAGAPAEPALSGWARRSRFAGSKDRRALRDLVFDALRRRRSYAARGGADTGRGLMLGRLRDAGEDPDSVFTGVGHAPPPLSEAERTAGNPPEGAAARDLPDWLWDRFEASLGTDADGAARALRDRAPVHLRVNLLRTDRARAVAALAGEGICARPVETAETALEVTEGARLVARSRAFLDGLVELQDAASQAVVARLAPRAGGRVLDYCAGGGGKTLALAALARAPVWAHDAHPRRMRDLPARAARAQADVRIVDDPAAEGPFDIVLCDAPCSGSGSWRRDPEAKWRLDPEGLAGLEAMQARILETAAQFVAPGGRLAYATCSVLEGENRAQVEAFLARNPGWVRTDCHLWLPGPSGDGFFLAVLTAQ